MNIDNETEKFAQEMRLQQLRETTIYHYTNTIRRFLEEHKELTQSNVDSFLSEANNTLNRSAIKKYLLFKKKKGIEVRKTKKQPRKIPVTFTESDTQRILNNIDSDYRLVVELLIETGCRIGEALAIRRQDIKEETNSILLPVTKSRPRIIYPSPELIKKLISNSYKPNTKEGWVFPSKYGSETGHIHQNTVRLHLKKALEGAKPHTFRHTFATNLLEEGVDLVTVRDLVGHEDIGTTSIYTHVARPKAREAAKKRWIKK